MVNSYCCIRMGEGLMGSLEVTIVGLLEILKWLLLD